jgi:tetratricopeptide (TPR) repeat protein
MANGKNAEARTAFLAARAIDPKVDSVNLALINLDLMDHKVDDARRALEARLHANTNDTMARLWLANLDEEGGDHAGALKEYRRVVDADPRNAQALNNLAYLLVDYKHEPEEALQYAQKAQEIDPMNPNFTDTVGWVMYRKGLYTLAVKDFAEAASKPGAAAVCNYHLAMAYAKLGDREHGLAALNVALRTNPKLPEAGEASQMLRQ